jgi:cell wall-associated NlpC family hydrolase
MRLVLVLVCAFLNLCACVEPNSYVQVAAPAKVRLAALDYARKYIAEGTTYGWGAQDALPRLLALDCSGLVVRCYGYACDDLGYSLPFNDMNSAGMRAYTTPVDPEPGDLIFMGTEGKITHVALFVRREGTDTYFIDSTEFGDVSGVTERSYDTGNPKFIAYGRLIVKK